MAKDLGTGVSTVAENQYYNYDMVVFQKGMPILDSELNLLQQIQLDINQKQLSFLPSGWLSYYPFHTDKLLPHKFYTQNPAVPKPEYALINGIVVHVTNTGSTLDNLNIVDFSTLKAPETGNRISGVFLEAWRSLLAPESSTNKPDPASVIDTLFDISMASDIIGWAVGENGLILKTENAGQTWSIQAVNTKHKLSGVSFPNKSVGWAVGENGTIVRTANAGLLWSLLPVVTPENLTSISSINQIMAWAVGDNGTVIKTINGVNWTILPSGVTANLRKVHFNINGLIGWAVGENGTIIKTTSGGASWRVVPSGTTANLNSIYFYDLNYGFAVGEGGTILRTSDGGESWVSQSGNISDGIPLSPLLTTTNNLKDVVMFPHMDLHVLGEEVTSQFNGTSTVFVTEHPQITVGDGRGTITDTPAYITVTVGGQEVVVDSMNGASGTVTLKEAPAVGKTVLVYYWYRNDTAVFSGWGWIVGQNGMLMRTHDIGQTWEIQTSNTSYDLNAVRFIEVNFGWTVGDFSVIRKTENGINTSGSTWTEQLSDVVAREMQRIYKEGNVGTDVFLFDNSINPDAVVETTKRVQVQYRIRIQPDVDPEAAPSAGLSGNVLGNGPNDEGSFGYENMGPISGDYGLWRAQCLNTVDGYCYAIPMFFVAQRNSSAWNVAGNPNGSYIAGQADALRPDLLTSSMIVDSDILDVRHKIFIQGEEGLMEDAYDELLGNTLRTRMARGDTGDEYGSELLQIDRVSGTSGGTMIPNATLAGAVAGTVTSSANLLFGTALDPAYASTDPQNTEFILTPLSNNGYFPDDPSYYSAVYLDKPTTTGFSWKPLPGYFTGLGTSSVKFVYGPGLKSKDIVGDNYQFNYAWVDLSTNGLTHVPSTPYLVVNQGASSAASYYNGVMESDSSRIIDQWDAIGAGMAGYRNYVVAYPYKGIGDFGQQHRASPVELHMFMNLNATNVSPNGSSLTFPTVLTDASHSYKVLSVSEVNNVTGGFAHKLTGQTYPDASSTVSALPGYEFVQGGVVEVVTAVKASADIYSGATVNIHAGDKSIRSFCRSDAATLSISAGATAVYTSNSAVISGLSSMNMASSPNQYFCWVSPSTNVYNFTPVSVSGLDTTSATLTFPIGTTGTAYVQGNVKLATLDYQDDAQDALYIAYSRNPQQAVNAPPASITLNPVYLPPHISISNMGTGGGGSGMPYQNPLEHIAVNDSNVLNDNVFNNIIPLRFPVVSVDSGYAEKPPVIPGSIEQSFMLSGPAKDNEGRWYYSACSKEFSFEAEGLTVGVPRKIYTPMLCLVEECSDSRFLRGEYVMVVFSRNEHLLTANVTGFKNGSNYVACVYRIPNKPLTRM